jgi:hypothetical protein
MVLTDLWRFWRYPLAQWQLQWAIRAEQPNVIHSNDLPTHQMMGAAAQAEGVPRVCHHRFPFDGKTIDWFNKFGAERHVFVSHALMDEMCLASEQLAASPRSVLYDGLPLPPVPTPEDRLKPGEWREAHYCRG